MTTSEREGPSDRTQLRRHHDRGHYDREQIYAILDEGLICHLGCVADGQAWVLPTAYGREGDVLYVHGAAANHLLKSATDGQDVVVTVTLTDGMVLARSTFNHSFNYRSVVLFGPATLLTEPAEKAHGLEVIVDRLLPGRSGEARPPTEMELKQTRVLRLPIDEASAKVRSGPASDEPEDVDLPIWAGVLPLHTVAGPAEPDPHNQPGVPDPAGLVQPRRWTSAR